jgi:hypothetical protein
MRRLLRILHNGLTFLCLLLALAFAGPWLRSHWRWDTVVWNGSGGGGPAKRALGAALRDGRLDIAVQDYPVGYAEYLEWRGGWHWRFDRDAVSRGLGTRSIFHGGLW